MDGMVGILSKPDPRPADDPTLEATSAERADRAMARYAKGDDAAFAEVYDEVAPRLAAFLARRASCPRRAEELLQQTFLRLHLARGRFIPGAPVLPWTYAIARRLLLDDLRREGRRGRRLPGGPDLGWQPLGAPPADASLDARRALEQLQHELEKLPESQRRAFELLRFEERSLEEIAQATGATVSAVKSRVHRATEAIRLALSGRRGE